MSLLSKEQFALMSDTDYAFVDVIERENPDDDVPQVRVRSLMSDEREKLQAMIAASHKNGTPIPGGINAWYCAMGMVNEHGLPLFTGDAEGVAIMSKKHPELVARIADRIYELSKMTKSQRELAEKKLAKANSSDSPSSSVEPSTLATDSTTAAS